VVPLLRPEQRLFRVLLRFPNISSEYRFILSSTIAENRTNRLGEHFYAAAKILDPGPLPWTSFTLDVGGAIAQP
jgi:hypothetical protein